CAVVDVHDVAGEKKLRDERDDAPIGRENHFADAPTIVHAEVTAGDAAVEDAAGAESTGDLRVAGAQEWERPQRRRLLSSFSNFTSELVLMLNARLGRRVQSLSEALVDVQTTSAGDAGSRSRRRRSGWRLMRILEEQS